VTGTAVYYAYYTYAVIKKLNFWLWGLIVVAIVFNPISPVYLGDKTIWGVIGVMASIFFASFITRFKDYERKN